MENSKRPGIWGLATLWILAKLLERFPLFTAGELREYCQWENFNATCGPDEVILMQSAHYGRIRFGRCMQEDHGNVGCSADVLSHLDRKCSGRRQCHLTIPDAALHSIHPCPKELMPYLEASYFCINVHSPVANGLVSCGGGGHFVYSEVGFLASLTTEESVVGTVSCPWVIHAHPGRRINLTLYSFAAATGEGSSGSKCAWGVVVLDRNLSTTLPVCTSGLRERRVYSSVNHVLRLFVKPLDGKTLRDHVTMEGFIIRYQVFGCADITHIANAHVIRQRESMSIKCNSTGETFFLICVDSRWKGELSNCTKGRRWSYRNGGVIPYGILLTIGLGVASGVAFGVVVLFGFLIWARSYGRKLNRRSKERCLSHRLDTEDLPGAFLLDYKETLDTTSGLASSCTQHLCPYHQLMESNLDDEPLVSPEVLVPRSSACRQTSHSPLFHVSDVTGIIPSDVHDPGSISAHARTLSVLGGIGSGRLNLEKSGILGQKPVVIQDIPLVSGSSVDLIRDSSVFVTHRAPPPPPSSLSESMRDGVGVAMQEMGVTGGDSDSLNQPVMFLVPGSSSS